MSAVINVTISGANLGPSVQSVKIYHTTVDSTTYLGLYSRAQVLAGLTLTDIPSTATTIIMVDQGFCNTIQTVTIQSLVVTPTPTPTPTGVTPTPVVTPTPTPTPTSSSAQHNVLWDWTLSCPTCDLTSASTITLYTQPQYTSLGTGVAVYTDPGLQYPMMSGRFVKDSQSIYDVGTGGVLTLACTVGFGC